MSFPPISVFYAQEHVLHDPKNNDSPARAENIVEKLKAEGKKYNILSPHLRDSKFIEEIHSKEYLQYLEQVCEVLQPEEVFQAEIFAYDRSRQRKPTNLRAQVGWWCYEATTGLCKETYKRAVDAAYCAVSAANILKGRTPNSDAMLSYALCRPPGHHATKDRFGGYCYLNNAAIAANYLTQHEQPSSGDRRKVAVLDIDFHGGNGTQDIFYERNDVLTVSIHGDPNEFGGELYFWGFEDEKGSGEGLGYNVNLPLWDYSKTTNNKETIDPSLNHQRIDESVYMKTLQVALEKIQAFQPEFLVVSYGVDTYSKDAIGLFFLEIEDYYHIGQAISKAVNIPTLVVQEGGYHDDLGNCVHELLQGMSSSLYK